MTQYRALLDFIYRAENGGKIDYDVIYGGIKAHHRPKKPLTQMTIGEVLAWQDSIDKLYNSEAAGAGQFMEDTLRGLVHKGIARSGELFSPEVQDRLALALLSRRGLRRWERGEMSTAEFGNNLAKEWASLPLVAPAYRGKRRIERGFAYYGGVGSNHSRALVDVGDFEAVLAEPSGAQIAASRASSPRAALPGAASSDSPFFLSLRRAVRAFLGRRVRK